MVTIQILSDLHLEVSKTYDLFEIVPKAPYLALLGDIGVVEQHKTELLAFLTKQLRGQFSTVFFVPGNHEAYHSSWANTIDILRGFEGEVRRDASLGEFVLLDRAAYYVPNTNVVILGCSLFSMVPPEHEMDVGLGLNDFYRTKGWDVAAHNQAHRRDLAWLNAQVSELEGQCEGRKKIVILSHWSPSGSDHRGSEPRHLGSKITSGFSTDLSTEACFTSEMVKIWAFGHTHYNCDFVVEREKGAGPLRLLTNQRGYAFAQAENYDGEKTVDI